MSPYRYQLLLRLLFLIMCISVVHSKIMLQTTTTESPAEMVNGTITTTPTPTFRPPFCTSNPMEPTQSQLICRTTIRYRFSSSSLILGLLITSFVFISLLCVLYVIWQLRENPAEQQYDV